MNDSTPSSSFAADSNVPLPPPRIPDHELIRRIGRGAYGEVWIARSVTGAFRAVKIVRRSTFDHARPFEREFEGIQRFEPVSRTHESQVDILHVGRGEDYFYYVMELADDQATGGQINPDNYHPRTLKSDLLFRSRLPFEECVSIGIALTTALEHLHKSGLVHRDVKPSNIIFVNGVAKLADIGLVTGVDTTRSYVGTEGFAAPEGPGTPQGDLFSLGKVLYEMSTGKDRQEFPELPTNLRELPEREGLLELNAVIAKACRHDPRDRYPNAAAMRADLELLQSGKSLARLHRMEKQLRTLRRTGVAVAGLAVLILAGWFYQVRQTRMVRELANANARLANEKSKLADEKTKLAEENRVRVVRLNVANGVRLMDAGDMTGGLLWFAEALPFVTNVPSEESIHRIRIQQVLNRSPRLLQVMAHESSVASSSFSPDGRRVATVSSNDRLRVWDAQAGRVLWEVTREGLPLQQVRFTRDGRRLFISSSEIQSRAAFARMTTQFAEIVDAEAGNPVFPRLASNLVCSGLSPNDRWLAVALTNHVIRVLDAHNGATLLDLAGHTNEVTMLSFSRDGGLLASASLDQTARLWRLPSGEPLGPPLRHDHPIRQVIFSPDARRIATATGSPEVPRNCIIQTWDTQTSTRTGPPIKALKRVLGLAFDDTTGRRLLTGDDEFMARVRDSETHEELLPPLKMDSTVRCWAFSPDGRCVAIGSDDGTARIWSLDTGELLFPPFRHTGWVESVQFSPDGTRLLTTSDDGTAKLWDLSLLSETAGRRQLPGSIPKLEAYFFPATLSPDGRHLWAGMEEPTVRLINVGTIAEEGKPTPDLPGELAGRVEFDALGGQWAAGEGEFQAIERSRGVRLWRREADRVRQFVLPHGGPAIDIRFSPDGERLVTLGKDHLVRTWKTQDGGQQGEVRLPGGHERALLSDDARLVILLFANGEGQLFDISTASMVGKPFRHRQSINAVRFSADGRRFATASDDQTGRIWDTATGEPLTPPFKHGGAVGSVDWSPDGKRVVTAGLSPEARIWDTATGEPLLSPLAIGNKPTHTARWSLDGRFIVTRNDDNVARVWDAARAEAVTPLLKHEGYIRLARLAANNRLITVSDPNVLRAWDLTETQLPLQVLMDYARLLSGHRLNASGVSIPLKPSELADLLQSLRRRAPQLFQ